MPLDNKNHTSVDDLARLVRQQADILFPHRTDSSMFLKMYGELGELIAAKTRLEQAGELADVMIMLLDYGDKHGLNIEEAVRAKMAINQNRSWKANELGVFSHVK